MAEQKPQAKSELLEAIRFNRAQKALDVVLDGQSMRVSENGCDALALVLALAKGSESWERVAMAMIEQSKALLARGDYAGSCLDASDADGRPALMMAMEAGQTEIGLALVEAGASVVCRHGGADALNKAIELGTQASVEIGLAMIEKSRRWIAGGGNTGSSCLDAGGGGMPPLFACAMGGQARLGVALVEAGAKINSVYASRSAFARAIERGDAAGDAIARAMISKSREAIARRIPGGSCLDALGEKKRPALMAALAKQNWRLARLMVDSGASMSARHEGVGALDVLAVSASPEAQALGVHMLALQASGRGVGSCMDNQRALAVLEKARRVGESLLPKAMKWCGINAGSQNYEPGMCLPDHASLKKLDEELSAIYGDAKVGALEAMGELARKAREELRLALQRGGAAAARKPAI